jgi:hypothetical protein
MGILDKKNISIPEYPKNIVTNGAAKVLFTNKKKLLEVKGLFHLFGQKGQESFCQMS